VASRLPFGSLVLVTHICNPGYLGG
jgi:hypothetical protein